MMLPPSRETPSLSSIARYLWEVLRRRWLLIATIIFVIFGAAIVTVMLMTPRYDAVSRIRIDPSRSAAMGQLSDQQGGLPDQGVVDTEVSVMRSFEVAKRVVERLGLDQDPEFSRNIPPLPNRPSQQQIAARLNAVIMAVLKATSAEREKATYIVDIRASSIDPLKAARIANSFAGEYIAFSLTRRSSTAEQQSQFLGKRLKELSDEATAAESQLAEYRAQAGVIPNGSGSSTMVEQQIAPLSSQLATAQSEAAAAAAKVRSAEAQVRSGGTDSVSAVLTSDVIRAFRTQRAELLQAQGEIQTRYGPKHPETQRVAQQLADLDGQIDTESRRIIAGLRADASSAEARAQSLAAELSRLRAEQTSSTRSSAIADTYQRRADSAKTAYDLLAQRASASEQAAGSNITPAQIIEDATPPALPSRPRRGLLLGLSLIVATLTATGAVLVLELANSGVRSAAELQKLGLTVHASIPMLSAAQLVVSGTPVTPTQLVIRQPIGFYAETFRTLRSALILRHQADRRILSIVSTLPGEGKTTTALSLARVMALAGTKLLVIDCDFRRAGLTEAAGIDAKAGLADVLRGEVPVDQAIVPDVVGGLSILPLAERLFTPEDLFSGPAMQDLLKDLRGRYEFILLDTPPLLSVADARTLATLSDAVVMVVKWNSTPRNAVRASLDLLANDHVDVVGSALTMVDRHAEAYGAMYYSKKYAHYYKEE